MNSDSATTDFVALYETWSPEIARWIRQLGGPEGEREDLLQDVFLIVHRRLHAFDGRNLGGWLYQITRHRVRDVRCRLWFKHLVKHSSLPDDLAEDGSGPAERLETKQRYALVQRAFHALPEPERVALALFELDGYSGEELASLQGVSLNTVWSRIRRARGKLTSIVGKVEDERQRRASRDPALPQENFTDSGTTKREASVIAQ